MNIIAPIGHNNPPSETEILIDLLAQKEKELRHRMKFAPAPAEIADEQQAGRITDEIKAVKNIIRLVSDIHSTTKKPYLECGRIVDAWKKRLEVELEVICSTFAKPLNVFLDKRAQEERARQIEEARLERERAEALAAEAQAHAQAGISDTANDLLDAAVSSEAMANRIEDHAYTATPSQLAKSRSMHCATASQKLVWIGEIQNISAIDLNKLRAYFTTDALQKAVNAFIRDGGRSLDGVLIEQRPQLNVR